MYIKRIYIRNFKSIKEIDVYPTKWLNAFIWENSTGKSNIFKALDWVLWKSYPTFNQVSKEDHFMWDEENKIQVIIEFNDWMIFWLNENEEKYKFKMEKDWNKSFNENDRKKYSSAYLDTKREINDYMPSNKWSLLWRILQEVNTKFWNEEMVHFKTSKKVLKKDYLKETLTFIKEKVLFTVKNDDWDNIMEKLVTIIQKETSNQLNREMDEFNVDFNLYDPWNFYRTLQITVKEQNWLEFQAWDLGMWVQASISIAILKAYSELNLNNNSPIFIDEPELYLHPQAQRNFYNILKEVSSDKIDYDTWEILKEWTQIFYNTHSPDFLSAWRFNEIFLIRKCNTNWTYINNPKIKNYLTDLKTRKSINSNEDDYLLHMQIAYEETWDTQKANEAFFAKKIILVEWQSESLILPYLFKLVWFDYIKEWISIVRCWSKSEIDRFYRIYNEFWIPCYLIFDWDKQNSWTWEEKGTIDKNKELLSLLWDDKSDFPDNLVHDNYLWFEYILEENLWFKEKIWNDVKSLALFRRVKDNIKSEKDVPSWILEVIKKINSLDQSKIKSILKIK